VAVAESKQQTKKPVEQHEAATVAPVTQVEDTSDDEQGDDESEEHTVTPRSLTTKPGATKDGDNPIQEIAEILARPNPYLLANRPQVTRPQPDPVAADVTEDAQPVPEVIEKPAPGAIIATLSTKITGEKNIAAFKANASPETIKQVYLDFEQQLKAAPDVAIAASRTPLSARQQQRVKYVAELYKTITLEPSGKTLAELAMEAPPTQVVRNRVDTPDLDLVDDSLRNSRLDNVDTDYVNTTLDSDLARTLLTFNTKGMFITDVKTDVHSDALNRFRTYRVSYEDVRHEKHTVVFTLPLVDENGQCLINSIPMRLTKQRINNPIVVSGPNRVSLNTNYNKTLVERNTARSHSIHPYVERLLEKSEFTVTRGAPSTKLLEVPIAKEELPAFTKVYETGATFFLIRSGDEVEEYRESGPHLYLVTPAGPVMVMDEVYTPSLKAHAVYKRLSAARKTQLDQADSFVILTVEPAVMQTSLPAEYTSRGQTLKAIERGNLRLHFHYHDRLLAIPASERGAICDLEQEYGVYLGTIGPHHQGFLGLTGAVAVVDVADGKLVRTTTIIDELCRVGNIPSVPPCNEFVELKILNKTLPVGFVLCYRYGLQAMLDYMGVKSYFAAARSRPPKDTPVSALRLRFADGTLYIPRTPNVAYLIFAGLAMYDLRKIYLEDMDTPDVYYTLIQQRKLSINYLKGVDSFFELFIDPITAEVLAHLGEPTNVRDLLIRAVALLSSNDHEPASASLNCRIRSYERFSAVLYNEMSRAFANYVNRGIGSRNSFSLQPHAVMMRIATDQLMSNVDVINPIHTVKERSLLTHTGDGGRSTETFMVDDRRFTADQLGIVSESTVDNGKVGINVMTPVDPDLANLRGMATGMTPETAQASNILSVTGLLFPGVSRDDPKRAMFVNIQRTHQVPTEHADVYPIGTGFEKVFAHRCSPPFAQPALADGQVVAIDEKTGMVEIAYSNGDTYSYEIGDEIAANISGSFQMAHPMVLNKLKVGQRFKRGDIILYNPLFFEPDPTTRQVTYKLGVTANVALVEEPITLEDSSAITQHLSEQLAFSPIVTRDISINCDTTIHEIVEIGDVVDERSALIVMDESKMTSEVNNPELAELLRSTNRAAPRAKHAGEIVKIEAFYRCSHDQMSPIVKKVVKAAERAAGAKAAFAANTTNHDRFPKPSSTKMSVLNRVGTAYLTDDNVVLRFYIQHRSLLEVGSKVIYDSSLKSVVGQILAKRPQTEDGSMFVDAFMGWRALQARIITSPILCGLAVLILRHIEQLAVEKQRTIK